MPETYDFELFVFMSNEFFVIRGEKGKLIGRKLGGKQNRYYAVSKESYSELRLLINHIGDLTPMEKLENVPEKPPPSLVEYAGSSEKGGRVRSISPISAFVRNAEKLAGLLRQALFEQQQQEDSKLTAHIQMETNALLRQIVLQKLEYERSNYH